MKYNDKEYKSYKQLANEDGSWTMYCKDDDDNEMAVIVDENNEILEIDYTGECACHNCRG